MSEKPHSLLSSTGYWVTRLAGAIEMDFEKRLKMYEVTRASWAVLSAIQHHDQTMPGGLASFIGIDRAAITRHLDRLEKQELVYRRHSSTDRREVNLKLTQKGIKLISELAVESLTTNDKFTAGLTQSENDALQSSIKKMLSNSDVVLPDL